MYLDCFFLSIFTLHQVFEKVVECVFQLYRKEGILQVFCFKFSHSGVLFLNLREVTIND